MGNKLATPEMSKDIFHYLRPGIRCVYTEVNGWRTGMEDKVIFEQIDDNWHMAFVMDGHSGSGCSENLQHDIPIIIKKLFTDNQGNLPSDSEIEKGLIELDKHYLKTDDNSGSTLTGCLININTKHIIIINVGDSRTICFNKDLIFASEDHSPENLIEHTRIKDAGGSVIDKRVDGGLALSRAFGDKEYKDKIDIPYEKQKVIAIPTITHMDLPDDSKILICCDGVYESNVFTTDSIITYINESKLPIDVCIAKLVDTAHERGSFDNITAMYLEFVDTNMSYNNIESYPGVLLTTEEKKKDKIRNSYLLDTTNYIEKRLNNLENYKNNYNNDLYYGYIEYGKVNEEIERLKDEIERSKKELVKEQE